MVEKEGDLLETTRADIMMTKVQTLETNSAMGGLLG